MDPTTNNSVRRFLRRAAIGIAAAAIVTVGVTQLLLPDAGGARCTGSCKVPPFKARWSYQLQGNLRLTSARVYDIDGVDTPRSFVARLNRLRRYAVCYIDAGTWEDWRPDSKRFPDAVLGGDNGWPGERWLDIRRTDVLIPIMRDRIATCRAKGFDAVEPDNVDGYTNETGFPLTAADQLRYNRRIANLAHVAGLAVGLKNDLDQIPALRSEFDFGVVEQCFQYDECDKVKPFLRVGKPVFEVEYEGTSASFCSRARAMGINAQRARLDLDRPGTPCR